jgi:catechol 2,3-dioxygenase
LKTDPPFFRATSLTEATLRVRALQPMLRFYCGALGLQLIAGKQRRVELSATGRAPALLVLEEDPEAEPAPPDSTGLFHIAFLYPDRPSLATGLRRVVERRHTLEGASDHGVSEAIYLSDPEQNGLELYADRPPELWPYQGRDVAMFTAPLNLNTLLSEANPTGYEYTAPPALRIGHIHLRVSDLRLAEAFYSRALGFEVRQRDLPEALFMGREGYHHHIGANTWLSREPAPKDALGLSHFTISLPMKDAMRAIHAAKAFGLVDEETPSHAALRDSDSIGIIIRASP